MASIGNFSSHQLDFFQTLEAEKCSVRLPGVLRLGFGFRVSSFAAGLNLWDAQAQGAQFWDANTLPGEAPQA